jgi:hypothetical protein
MDASIEDKLEVWCCGGVFLGVDEVGMVWIFMDARV